MSMGLKQIFVGSGGLRNGWRFAVFAAIWFVSGPILFHLVSLAHTFSDNPYNPADMFAWEVADAIFILLVSIVLVRLEGHRISWFGFGFGSGSLKLFGVGCLWGFVPVTLVLIASSIGGHVSINGFAEHGANLWKYLAIWLSAMLLLGLGEELQLRGYPLAALARGIGFWPAALILSILFGAMHLYKPMENVPDILNIFLYGLFCCYTVRRTGSLWLAIGEHASFDFFALAFYGSPNTGANGLPLEHHLLDTNISGPDWLTGGPQGLEASWLMTPMVLISIFLIHKLYPEDNYPHD